MDLILNLKKQYFTQIKNGEKKEEYRELKEYWVNRIIRKPGSYYKNVIIRLGYPKSGDIEREIIFPYKGYEIKKITHEIFGGKEKSIIAIKLEK